MKRRRKKEKKPGYGKLLDAWTAPSDAGDAIGCLATTFTFSSEFFEIECLSRFARLESDPDEDGAAYLIEREEKLSQLACAAVLVDQHHCRGARSPRWDLIGIRPPRGIQHAKIAILHWTNCLRIIVGSANLTEDGYRRNREVFGVLNFREQESAPLDCSRQTVTFLREMIDHAHSAGSSDPAIERCRTFLDETLAAIEAWASAIGRARPASDVRPIFAGPDHPSVFDSLTAAWPMERRPDRAEVVSPFFDPPEADNRPAKELWNLLRGSGTSRAAYHLTAEVIPGEDGLYLHAPQSILDAQPSSRRSVETELHRLSDEPTRPFHAKAMWIENNSYAGYLIGSSNFTSAGLGLGKAKNFEANLLYLAHLSRGRKVHRALLQSFPESERIDAATPIRWQPQTNEDEPDDAAIALLPKQFQSAIFDTDEAGGRVIRLTISGTPPRGWWLAINEGEDRFFDEAAWEQAGRPETAQLPWPTDRAAPFGFTVYWEDSAAGAWWPVNIENAAALPPPDDLRDLPLEALIEILTSGRPLHRAMHDWLRRKNARKQAVDGSGPDIDPHKRVDSSTYLLQRTRRVSWALTALRERLERPIATRESLRWRLNGPIGVEAIANALTREAQSDEERCFLLTELAMELMRVRPSTSHRALDATIVLEEINLAVRKLFERFHPDAIESSENLRAYVQRVRREVLETT